MCWAVAVALATGCASSPVRLPRGEGEAFPTYDEAVREATSACRGVRTLSAELSVSGRSGPDRVRGHVAAGLARPSGLRLEGAAPFGPPAFILVSDASGATLLLPRDHRVLTGTSSAEILEALVGLRLAPDDLMALLTGCVVPDPRAVAGRRFGGGWAAADVGQGASLYLREGRDGRWVVRAAVRPPMTIEDHGADGGLPAALRVRTGESDLQIGLTQVDINTTLPPRAFQVNVPADAEAMTLADLRHAGTMGQKR